MIDDEDMDRERNRVSDLYGLYHRGIEDEEYFDWIEFIGGFVLICIYMALALAILAAFP